MPTVDQRGGAIEAQSQPAAVRDGKALWGVLGVGALRGLPAPVPTTPGPLRRNLILQRPMRSPTERGMTVPDIVGHHTSGNLAYSHSNTSPPSNPCMWAGGLPRRANALEFAELTVPSFVTVTTAAGIPSMYSGKDMPTCAMK